LGKTEAASFDIGQATVVKVNRVLERPHETSRIVYRAQLTGSDPSKTFMPGLTQSVRPIDDRTVEVVVRSIRPDVPPSADSDNDQPMDDDRQPNNMIQSDNPRVVEMAAHVSPDEKDTWRLACDLERHVKKSITEKNFTKAFATAAEVAQSLEGDCTEHAVLLAALCRAREIPARVAIGLVYFPNGSTGGFAYHMWTEAWIKDRWIPLDGTLGKGGIGAAHIKLDHSNLHGSSAYSTFLPVFTVMGQLALEIVDVEYADEKP
jgi:transglutaminase-like putative cysteine protease